MKKNYLTLLIAIIGFLVSYAQDNQDQVLSRSVFNDAKYIADNPAKRDSILAYYFKNNNEVNALRNKYTALNGFRSFTIEKTLKDVDQMRSNAVIQGNLGIGAILNPTTAIDALGSVIAERFKQEINIAFLKKFKDELDKEPYLGLLFPESKKVLLSSDPYNYPVFMNALKEAFEVDTANLIKNLPSVVNQLKPGDPKLMALATFLKILPAGNISNVIIKEFNALASNDSISLNNDVKKTVCGIAFALNAVKTGGVGPGAFINKTDLGYFNNVGFVTDYVALLFRQNEQYLEHILSDNTIAANKITSFVKEAVPAFVSIGAEAQKIATENTQKKLTTKSLVDSYSVVLDNLKTVMDSYKKYINPNIDTKVFNEVYQYSNSAIKIAGFISEKKYGVAFVELTQYIGLLQDSFDTERFSRFKKYTGFISNALAAENKDELMDALDTSAQPVGSYRVKRNSTVDISINAFAGGFVGTDFGTKEAVVYGFTAPVGIYLGFGNIWKKFSENPLKDVDGKSLGVFFSVIDVGAVTAFRLQDNSTEMADVTWNNVFAPGAYLSFGLGKCPVSLNLGGQMGPELTKINADGTPEFVTKEWYWRFGAVIDIPLYNLFSKQRSYTLRKKEDEDKEAKDEIDLRNKERAKKSAKK